MINELVCEGCGDCGVQSNCLSVEPLETEFGRKRQINQSTCNKDYSCVKGFCPSFVTVEGGQLRKKSKGQGPSPFDAAWGALPEPTMASTIGQDGQVWGIVVAGVGGTGVITIGQILGMAAHLEGKGIVTQDAGGLAQKGGATWSHVLIGASQDAIRTTRVGMAGADLIIGCDPVVAASTESLLRMRGGRTHVALNFHATPTAAFVKNANWQDPADACVSAIARTVGPDAVAAFNTEAAASRLMGDSIYTNPMLLGFAWQKGWIPLKLASLLRAIELNAVAVDQNKAAFAWGRHAAQDPAAFDKMHNPGQVVDFAKRDALDVLIAKRVAFLTDYQNAAYAESYQGFVQRVRSVDASLGHKHLPLTEAVARYLFKLMAYKDEYEVARLHSHPDFNNRINALFEGDFKIHYHLAPPLLAQKNARGELQKRPYGPAMLLAFKLLARLNALRGTALDIFGKTQERRQERALITEYRASVDELLHVLGAGQLAGESDSALYPLALEIARIPDQIRGFGHVKARHLGVARQNWQDQMTLFRGLVAPHTMPG